MTRRLAVLMAIVAPCSPSVAQPLVAGRSAERIDLPFAPASRSPNQAWQSATLAERFSLLALPRRVAPLRLREPFIGGRWPLAAPPLPIMDASADVRPLWVPVPAWMRQAPPRVLPVAKGCAVADYRPSGVLGFAAERRRRKYFGFVHQVACETALPPALLDALIIRESAYDPLAVSPRAAFGLTQLMSGTAAAVGVDRRDIVDNLRGGARYLRQQLDHFGDYRLALAAYNAGPAKVLARVVPRIAETQAYVDAVLTIWARLERNAVTSASLRF